MTVEKKAKKAVDNYVSKNGALIKRILNGAATEQDAKQVFDWFLDKDKDESGKPRLQNEVSTEAAQRYFIEKLVGGKPKLTEENLHKLGGLLLKQELNRTKVLTPPNDVGAILRTTSLAKSFMMYESEILGITDKIYADMQNLKTNNPDSLNTFMQDYIDLQIHPKLKDHFAVIHQACTQRKNGEYAVGQIYAFNLIEGCMVSRMNREGVQGDLQQAYASVRKKIADDVVYPNTKSSIPGKAGQDLKEARKNAYNVLVAQIAEGVATDSQVAQAKDAVKDRAKAYFAVKELETHNGVKLEPINDLLAKLEAVRGEVKAPKQQEAHKEPKHKESKGFFAAVFKFFRSDTKQHKPETQTKVEWKENNVYQEAEPNKPAVQEHATKQVEFKVEAQEKTQTQHAAKHAPRHSGHESPLGKRLQQQTAKRQEAKREIEGELNSRAKWMEKHPKSHAVSKTEPLSSHRGEGGKGSGGKGGRE